VTETLDLQAYLARTGYDGQLETTVETLVGLHRAHVLSIPFENLDILLGRQIRLDLASLQAKLITGRRGGYCFEQNTLFAAVLERLGFDVTGLAARVRMGDERGTPRTHMVLAVDLDDRRWLADVGFGGDTLLDPIRFDDDQPVRQGAWSFQLVEERDRVRVLRGLRADGWLDLYEFTEEPQLPVDFEVGNHYTSTWPRSPFVTKVVVQRSGVDERWMMIEDELRVERPEGCERWPVTSSEARLSILAERFELEFPAGTRFDRTPPIQVRGS
jgi:N-hydroxyarylamine O-acetyltransferase